MKFLKIIFVLIFFIQTINITAQSKRFYYEVNFKLDSAGKYPRKDIVVLEINKNSNIFMSNEYIVTDSLNHIHKDNQNFAYPKFTEIVEYKKSDNSFNFIRNLSMNYYQFNAEKKINWKVSDEKKKIGNFNVTKATADFGGRKWTAWFCAEIPFPYGPYVFYGLPGLILEIADDNENYHFSFIQNKNYKTELNSQNIIKNLFEDRKINIKEKDWKTIQLNYYQNPIPEYKSGEAYMQKEDGSKYTANDYRDLEKNLQKQIKILNNPIEISEKVDYK